MSTERTYSPSPSRQTLGDKLSSFGSKLTRPFSHTDTSTLGEERDTVVGELHSPKDRSQSRGREPLQSTGRGGIGNIRQVSLSRDRAPGPDDFSPTRGREPIANPHGIYSTGRGGAGNLRSPSRDASRGPDRREKEVLEAYSHQEAPISTGRGGFGNITAAERSRSRDPAAARISTGRGGAGNLHANQGGYDVNEADELERKAHDGAPKEGFHSTGRGGFANLTEKYEPAVERHSISNDGAVRSTGRGGAGNIGRN